MKYKLAIFHYTFLPLSETFIYRQLQGLNHYFDLNFFTRTLQNTAEYPGIKPIIIPQQGFIGRLLGNENRFVQKQLRNADLFHVNFGDHALDMQHHARRMGIPMTAYFLGYDASLYLKSPSFCERLSESTFEAVFVNSEDMKRRLMPYLPTTTKCHVAYCGIPLERFEFKQRLSVREGATFLQVSRLDAKKGIDVSLKAFSRYHIEIDPSAYFVIAGDGPMKKELQRLSYDLGLEKHVSFIGSIGYQKYIELLRAADVFMHPSITAPGGDMEGIPTAICEAMACGLPVVTTRHSGIPELIDDGECGLMAEERDADGLFDKLATLRKADIRAMSINARKRIENKFDHNKTINILASLMHRTITDK